MVVLSSEGTSCHAVLPFGVGLSRVGCVDAECLAVLVVRWALSVELKWFMVFIGYGACLLMW